ncbi:response regulator [Paenibacillus ehimensis]|uniref:response regulator n=1 Tax=Paenibacillus ehimensis TaxID=79264 RepID=UPI000FDB37DA|nr:response regulator [Paenibacillus ehimensis]MEC0210138.1 response regulator [Paenibacillus ehimensis]
MYTILLVDDEPLICQGLSRLLASSGLNIHQLFIAHSGYEAMDYIRMEEVDLLITDIQMGEMSGIELMHQAKMARPSVQSIVVSAYETFQYAQLAMRLGAKDYLIKPLNGSHFLDSVRNVLLKMDKAAVTHDELIAELSGRFRIEEPDRAKTEALNRLLADPASVMADPSAERLVPLASLKGPYFAVLKMKLNIQPSQAGSRFLDKDSDFMQYAVLNAASELLGGQWNHLAFYSPDHEISIILQWDDEAYGDKSINKISQLDMIGRSLHANIRKHLSLPCVVGISQIMKGIEFIGALNEQARKAIRFHREHQDHYVFYYGDFSWNPASHEATEEELIVHHNQIVDTAKQYIHRHFGQKGLTLQEVAHQSHVSPNYLSYLFKKKTGYNLWDYVVKLRMEESRRLITSTDMRRYEIADKVGYESPEHFSKIFKKYYGISPSELKK